MKVKVQRISDHAVLPAYAHEGDAGMDIYAAEDVVVKPRERKLVGTGIKLSIERGYEAQVRPKSGLAANFGITVLNTPGTIDSGYRGEVKVMVINLGDNTYKIEKGMKIAQLVFSRVEKVEFEEVNELDGSARGGSGFGSTGLR